MSYFGQSSKHYLAVRIERNLTSGAAGIEWRLARPAPGWRYAEASAFTRLDGSWYLERLAERSTYVRYTLRAVLDTAMPDAMVSWVVKTTARRVNLSNGLHWTSPPGSGTVRTATGTASGFYGASHDRRTAGTRSSRAPGTPGASPSKLTTSTSSVFFGGLLCQPSPPCAVHSP